jgi:hypothetical protein
MNVSVQFLGLPDITKTVGKGEIDLEIAGSTVKDVFDELVRRFGKHVRDSFFDSSGNFDSPVLILRNEDLFVTMDDPSPLSDGDSLKIMLMAEGG